MTKKLATIASIVPSSAKKFNLITLDQLNRLWSMVYRADSVHKLLDRSERLGNCDCFYDTEGPKEIARDTADQLEQLLYEIGENPTAPWPSDEPIPKDRTSDAGGKLKHILTSGLPAQRKALRGIIDHFYETTVRLEQTENGGTR